MAIRPEFIALYQRAVQAGLVAAAVLFSGAIKEKLLHGYWSGDFVTGATAASVQISPPFRFGEGGAWAVRVGSNEMITLYWEMGHFNLFMRRYIRVEFWRYTLEEQGAAMGLAFKDAFDRVMAEGASA
jgi:hypothetical protein